MKGISMAIETIIYLILAILVLSVLLLFFLSQAGPPQDQFALEAKRDRFCASYTTRDYTCNGQGGSPIVGINPKLLSDIKSTCTELTRRFNFGYSECEGSDTLKCIQQCCLTCPQKQ